jgi:hypothetical protein
MLLKSLPRHRLAQKPRCSDCRCRKARKWAGGGGSNGATFEPDFVNVCRTVQRVYTGARKCARAKTDSMTISYVDVRVFRLSDIFRQQKLCFEATCNFKTESCYSDDFVKSWSDAQTATVDEIRVWCSLLQDRYGEIRDVREPNINKPIWPTLFTVFTTTSRHSVRKLLAELYNTMRTESEWENSKLSGEQ